MAAGDKTRVREGSCNGLNFELWSIQSNGTTAIVLQTKMHRVLHVSITPAEDIGTDNVNAHYVATRGSVSLEFTGALANKKHTVMVWGLI